MKKFYWLMIFSVILCTTSVYAFNLKFWTWGKNPDITENVGERELSENKVDFEIIPTMDTESNSKNTVWVGTFQLIWNDLTDELIKHPVEFVGGKSSVADKLNKKSFTADDLLESSYYKKWGLVSRNLKIEIEKGIKEKFNETSDILNNLDWTPAPEKYLLYAMLKKDFEYIRPFDKLPEGYFNGSEGKVKYFGINKHSKSYLRDTVTVLFYNGKDDYALLLKSKQGDNVYLYRTDDEKTLNLLYDDMIKKSKAYKGNKYFSEVDEFKAPNIDFKKERRFPELCNKQIKNTNFMISDAIETVQFKMDEVGVKLKSEAAIILGATCCPPPRIEPRYFYFDSRYVIFLQEKSKPYFAMKIEDAKAVQGK